MSPSNNQKKPLTKPQKNEANAPAENVTIQASKDVVGRLLIKHLKDMSLVYESLIGIGNEKPLIFVHGDKKQLENIGKAASAIDKVEDLIKIATELAEIKGPVEKLDDSVREVYKVVSSIDEVLAVSSPPSPKEPSDKPSE